MTKFENRFFKYILEQDDERAAMEASLDQDTDPADFDGSANADNSENAELSRQAAQIKSQQAALMESKLQEWITKCDEFLVFLNGTEEHSIQRVLSQAESDTIFDRMKQSEQRKISRVATELAALNESFRGYMAQADNPQFRYV